MIKKVILLNIIFLFFAISFVHSDNEVFIKYKVDNEIITNIDLNNEKNYLIALNNEHKNVTKKELNKLSTNSLIKEKIKKKELVKYFDLSSLGSFGEKIIEDFYKKIGFNDNGEFIIYLSKFDLTYEDVKEKLKIEALWNSLIFKKYNDKLIINEQKLKKELSEKINKNSKEMLAYNLSEIVFDLKSNEQLENKYKLIQNNISNYGFKETSSLISIASTAGVGGKVGWVNKTQLSKKIITNLNSINVGEYTAPIQINNAFLILKINDIRKTKKNINFEEEFEKLVIFEKNRQLNNFSIIHFNKIKKNINISET